MRIIEIINLSMEYNELLVKFTKGSIWLDNPRISPELKESFIPKWNELLKEMDTILRKFESIGITFRDCESIECIEIPDKFKRKDIEIYLENHYKLNNFDNLVTKDSEKTYINYERQGIKLF